MRCDLESAFKSTSTERKNNCRGPFNKISKHACFRAPFLTYYLIDRSDAKRSYKCQFNLPMSDLVIMTQIFYNTLMFAPISIIASSSCIQDTLSLRAALGLPAECVARAKVSCIQIIGIKY